MLIKCSQSKKKKTQSENKKFSISAANLSLNMFNTFHIKPKILEHRVSIYSPRDSSLETLRLPLINNFKTS